MITLIGLGPGDIDSLSVGAERALRQASDLHSRAEGRLLLRTIRHPVVDALRDWPLHYDALDSLYEAGTDFDSVYDAITIRVLETATADSGTFPTYYAVPGHPLVGEEATARIRSAARAAGIEVSIVASPSFVEAVVTACEADTTCGCDVRDALTLSVSDTVDRDGFPGPAPVDSSRPLILFQVYDQHAASLAKLALMREYPDDWQVDIVSHAGIPRLQTIVSIPLYELDRHPVDHLTSVYVPPLPRELRRQGFSSLVGIMARLRAPDGCPWDREQTLQSLRKYLIEETYEIIDAVDSDDSDHLAEELGDLLLQIVFYSQFGAEEGVFNIDDVSRRIVEKLIRRHPHVFGDISVEDSAEVLRNWERIKRSENTEKDPDWRKSVLDGVPRSLPALMRAVEISKRVVRVGFEWESIADVLKKADEEIAELKHELAADRPDPERVASEIGDVLFTIVQVARWNKLDPEECLTVMLQRFETRFRYVEDRVRESGREITSMSLLELDALWDEAKLRTGISAKSTDE